MKNFSPEFKTPEQYILDITYKIWEERGVDRIYDWYAADVPVRTPHGVTNTVEAIVQGTIEMQHIFPDREILAEDVIIGERGEQDEIFLSSHRGRSNVTHLGDGAFGPPTRRPVTLLAIADCLCRDNQVVDEWLVRDQAGSAAQLGLDTIVMGMAMGENNPDAYRIGNEAMHQRWSDPDGLVIVGDQEIGNRIIKTYESIWSDKNLQVMVDSYDRALRFEGPAGYISYGRSRSGNLFSSILASIPDGKFEPHHVIVRQQPDRPIRVALRWSYVGTHNGRGRYGDPSGVPLALLGISHFELRDSQIVNEWMVVDELAVYAQIAAYQAK